MSERELDACNRIFYIRNVQKGHAVCIGWTKEPPLGIPLGDVIHLCILTKERFEESLKTMKCKPFRMTSATPDEAIKLAINLIRATVLRDMKVKNHE